MLIKGIYLECSFVQTLCKCRNRDLYAYLLDCASYIYFHIPMGGRMIIIIDKQIAPSIFIIIIRPVNLWKLIFIVTRRRTDQKYILIDNLYAYH